MTSSATAHTLVVNYHLEDYDVLITRKTIFGNQSRITKDTTREQAIAGHLTNMQRKLRTEPGFHEAVMGLEGKRLGCVCKPMDCHGDLYVAYIKAFRAIEAQHPSMTKQEMIHAALNQLLARWSIKNK